MTEEEKKINLKLKDGTYFDYKANDGDNEIKINEIYEKFERFIEKYKLVYDDYSSNIDECRNIYNDLKILCLNNYDDIYESFKTNFENDKKVSNIQNAYNNLFINRNLDDIPMKNYDVGIDNSNDHGNYYIFGDTHGDFFPLIPILENICGTVNSDNDRFNLYNEENNEIQVTFNQPNTTPKRKRVTKKFTNRNSNNIEGGDDKIIFFLGDVFDPFNGSFVADILNSENFNDENLLKLIKLKVEFAQFNVIVFFYFIMFLINKQNFKIKWILGNHDLNFSFVYFYFFYLFYYGSILTTNIQFYFIYNINIDGNTYMLSHVPRNSVSNCIPSNKNFYKIINKFINTDDDQVHYKVNTIEKYVELKKNSNDIKQNINRYSKEEKKIIKQNIKLDQKNYNKLLVSPSSFIEKDKRTGKKKIKESEKTNIILSRENIASYKVGEPFCKEQKFILNIYGHVNHTIRYYIDENKIKYNNKPISNYTIKFISQKEILSYDIIQAFSCCLDSNISYYQITNFMIDSKKPVPCYKNTCNEINALYNKIYFIKYENTSQPPAAAIVAPPPAPNNMSRYGVKCGEIKQTKQFEENKFIDPNNNFKIEAFKDYDNQNVTNENNMKIVGYIVFIHNNKINFKNLIMDYQIHRYISTYTIYEKYNIEDKDISSYIKFGGSLSKYKGHEYNLRINNRIKTLIGIRKSINENKLKKDYKQKMKKFIMKNLKFNNKIASVNDILFSAENITWNFVLILNNLCLNNIEKNIFSPYNFINEKSPFETHDIYYPLQTIQTKHDIKYLNSYTINYQNTYMKGFIIYFNDFIQYYNSSTDKNMDVEDNNLNINKFFNIMINYTENKFSSIKENKKYDYYLKFNIKLQYYFYLYRLYIYLNFKLLPYTYSTLTLTFYDTQFILTILLYYTYKNYVSKLIDEKRNLLFNQLTQEIHEFYDFLAHEDIATQENTEEMKVEDETE